MKQWISPLLSGLSCLLALGCLLQISSLKAQQQELKTQLQNQLEANRASIQSAIGSINSSVSSSLAAQDGLLSSSSFSLEDFDLKNKTVQLRCVLTPKEFSPQETSASLCINGKDQPLTLRGSSFSLTLPVPLFQETSISAVSFTRSGSVRTQALDWSSNPRNLLPKAYVFLSGQSSTGERRVHYKGDLHISVEQEGGLRAAVEEIDLVELFNGKELSRQGLLNRRRENTVYWGGGQELTVLGEEPLEALYPLEGDYPSDENLTLLPGDRYQLVVEIKDSDGLVHRCPVDEYRLDAQGKLESGYLAGNEPGDLYMEGQLLYEESRQEFSLN